MRYTDCKCWKVSKTVAIDQTWFSIFFRERIG